MSARSRSWESSRPRSPSALGLVDGTMLRWLVLCAIYAACATCVSALTWAILVAPRFEASRGLALAIPLAGIGLGGAIWPLLASLYLPLLGWRLTFGALALTWLVVIFPLAYPSVRPLAAPASAPGMPPVAPPLRALGYREALTSRMFVFLMLGGVLFALCMFSLNVHLVSIFRANGITTTAAALLASVMGICSSASRIGTGLLLDRLPAQWIAIFAFTLPVGVCVLLLTAGASLPLSMKAAATMGLSLGAELDVYTYLATRYFGLRNFGGIYGIITASFGVCAGIGSLIAGCVYDVLGSYDASSSRRSRC